MYKMQLSAKGLAVKLLMQSGRSFLEHLRITKVSRPNPVTHPRKPWPYQSFKQPSYDTLLLDWGPLGQCHDLLCTSAQKKLKKKKKKKSIFRRLSSPLCITEFLTWFFAQFAPIRGQNWTHRPNKGGIQTCYAKKRYRIGYL